MDFNFETTTINGGILKMMQDKNRNVTIDAVYKRFDETGRIKTMNTEIDTDIQPHIYWGSDVFKWIEGASYVIAKHPDKNLEKLIENIIDDIEKCQRDDGYYNSYYNRKKEQKIFSIRNNHELYSAGHMIESAVAHYYATNKERYLDMAKKQADCIYKVFVEDKSADFVTGGHEEIELALIRLYRLTKEDKYLELARFFINQRGNNSIDEPIMEKFNSRYDQSELPVRNLEKAEGHSVRAMYLYTAMAYLAKEDNDSELKDVCSKLFHNIVNKKMYITGGIGSSRHGEAFTEEYDLPSSRAYAETCAAIGLMLFCQAMNELSPNGMYADTCERAMYNGMFSGLSLEGDAFFYENPLEINLIDRCKHTSLKDPEVFSITQRKKVFSCSCCPPNINRIYSSFERFLYQKTDGIYYINHFADSEYKDGNVKIIQKTNYPSEGKIELVFENVDECALRIPGWCDEFCIDAEYCIRDGYAYIRNPHKVSVNFVMKPKIYSANSNVIELAGKCALMYGPVVYCAEQIDNKEKISSIYLSKNPDAEVSYCDKCMMNKLSVNGYVINSSDDLYREINEDTKKVRVNLVPYYTFANRGETDMRVWFLRDI